MMNVDSGGNAGYMIAAYVVTAVILVGYAWVLWRRFRRALGKGLGNRQWAIRDGQ